MYSRTPGGDEQSVTSDGESFSVSELNTYTPRHRKTNTMPRLKVNKETKEIMPRNEM